MIRFASRVALIALPAFLASPFVARAQVPWRQVYKDSDVTVLLDTTSLALQSPGTWTTPCQSDPCSLAALSQIEAVPYTTLRLNDLPPSLRIRFCASDCVSGHSSSPPVGTRTSTSMPLSESRKNRVLRYLNSQPFGFPAG